MVRKVVVFLVCVALVALAGTAMAQKKQPKQQKEQAPPPVAGTQPVALGITVQEVTLVAKGWSVKQQILGKDVYNEKKEKVGTVDDLIVAPDKAISYAIIGAGGFLGMDKHDVAIPVNQFKMEKGKITLPGATKEALKAMPPFRYAK